MSDLISRQAAIDAIRLTSSPWLTELIDPYRAQVEALKGLPSAQKKGRWLYPTDVKGFCRCEHCGALWGRDLYENRFFKYCPRCGADMRGDED